MTKANAKKSVLLRALDLQEFKRGLDLDAAESAWRNRVHYAKAMHKHPLGSKNVWMPLIKMASTHHSTSMKQVGKRNRKVVQIVKDLIELR